MKKLLKPGMSIILVITIVLSLSSTTFAYEFAEPNISSMITSINQGKQEIKSISKNSINRIKNSNAKKFKNLTDKEKLNYILTNMNIEFNEQFLEKVNSEVNFSDVGNITLSTTYIKTDEAGNQIAMGKDEIYEDMAKNDLNANYANNSKSISLSSTSPTSSHNSNPETSTNGYMQQQILVIYTPNYNGTGTTPGRYVFFGACSWLREPAITNTDGISLGSPDIRWENKGTSGVSNFNLLVSYTRETTNTSAFTTKTENILDSYDENNATVSTTTGVYFSYNLPDSFTGLGAIVMCSNISFLISGIGFVQDYNNPSQQLSMDLRYVHTQMALSTSASFNWLTGGFVITTSPANLPKNYDHSYTWNYSNDYYA